MPYVLDLLVVTAFVLIGRATHEEGLASSGTLHALWPFVAALGAGWLVTRAARWPLAGLRSGLMVWATTLVGGLGLRAVTDQGTALPFVVVATLVLAAGLLGWRLIGILLPRLGHGTRSAA